MDLTINLSINFENLVINTILKTICENIDINNLDINNNKYVTLINIILENISKKELIINKDDILQFNKILIKVKNEISDAYILIINLCIVILQILSLRLKLEQENKIILKN